ncbi:uncharacterized protein LOC143031084 [Oratosquilla oratoria]|uniref:uncharacterized protein LOC143031084 n=1 Tax=Oratosquilla oratoria TaxID=337810 RepID=UPI003F76802C
MQAAFVNAEKPIAHATILSFPRPGDQSQLSMDASNITIGTNSRTNLLRHTHTSRLLQQEALPRSSSATPSTESSSLSTTPSATSSKTPPPSSSTQSIYLLCLATSPPSPSSIAPSGSSRGQRTLSPTLSPESPSTQSISASTTRPLPKTQRATGKSLAG